MIELVTNLLGVFAVRDGRVIERRVFPRDPDEIAERLLAAESGVLDEERAVIESLVAGKADAIAVAVPERFRRAGFPCTFTSVEAPTPMPVLAGEVGVSDEELADLAAAVNEAMTRERLKDVAPDQLIVQAVSALDDLDFHFNRMVERLREWYSLHFPELDHLVSSHETYVGLVCGLGGRGRFTDDALSLEPAFTRRILDARDSSLGAVFTDEDVAAVQAFATPLADILAAQKRIEGYVGDKMADLAPNTAALAGSVLGARLIAKAGGLQRLSRLPAGTIQILGAEDAFFRFLKSKKKPPKHGLIFAHPDIRNASKKVRGRLARSLAAKLAIAARADAFGGDFIGDRLANEFAARVKDVTKAG